MHGHHGPADTPAEQAQLVLAGGAQRFADRPWQLVADVVIQAHVGVLVAGHAPVEQEHVIALLEQELNKRVARPQIEDVGAVDQREDEQDRQRVRAPRGAVAIQRRLAMRPHHILRDSTPIRASSRVNSKLANSTAATGARANCSTAFTRSPTTGSCTGGPCRSTRSSARTRPAAPGGARPPGAPARACPPTRQLTPERRDVTPPRQPQVTHDEVGDVVADPRHRQDVLRRARQELPERVTLDQLLHRVRRALLSVLIKPPDVLRRIRSLAHLSLLRVPGLGRAETRSVLGSR